MLIVKGHGSCYNRGFLDSLRQNQTLAQQWFIRRLKPKKIQHRMVDLDAQLRLLLILLHRNFMLSLINCHHRLLDCHGQAQLGGKKRLRPVPNQKHFWKIVFYHHSDLRQHVATSNGVWNKKEIALALIKKNAPRFQNPDSTTSVRVIILVKYKSSKCLFCTSRRNGSRSGGSSSRSSGSSSSSRSSSSSSNSSTIVR